MMHEKSRRIVYHYRLEDLARQHPDKPLFLMGDRVVTYDEADRAANRIGRGFAAAGVKKGDRVLVMLPSSIDYALVWLGLCKIGALMVPVNEAYKAGMLQHQANNSGAKVAVIWSGHLKPWRDLGDALTDLETVFVYSDTEGTRPPSPGSSPGQALPHLPARSRSFASAEAGRGGGEEIHVPPP